MIPLDTESEIRSLRLNLSQASKMAPYMSGPASDKQIKMLNIVIAEVIKDRDQKLYTIGKLIGVSLESTKQITRWEASCLLNWILGRNYVRRKSALDAIKDVSTGFNTNRNENILAEQV